MKLIARDRTNNDRISRVYVSYFLNDTKQASDYTNSDGEVVFKVATDSLVRFDFDHVAFAPIEPFESRIFKGKQTDTVTLMIRMYFNKVHEFSRW